MVLRGENRVSALCRGRFSAQHTGMQEALSVYDPRVHALATAAACSQAVFGDLLGKECDWFREQMPRPLSTEKVTKQCPTGRRPVGPSATVHPRVHTIYGELAFPSSEGLRKAHIHFLMF